MNETTMETLARRLDQVERENRRLKQAGVVALAVISAAMLVAWGSAPPKQTKVVEAEKFILRDTKGKVRAVLGPTLFWWGKDRGIGLEFYDSAGGRQGKLHSSDDGTLLLIGRHDGPVLVLGASTDPEKGGAVLKLSDGRLELDRRAKQEPNRIWLMLRRSDGGVALRLSHKGEKAIELAVHADGSPRLTLSDKDGMVIWSAP